MLMVQSRQWVCVFEKIIKIFLMFEVFNNKTLGKMTLITVQLLIISTDNAL